MKKWLTSLFLWQFRLPRDVQRYAFKHYADRVFLRVADKAVTYGELEDRSYRLVQAWRAAGLRKGAVVFAQVSAGKLLFELRAAATEAGLVLTTFHHGHSPQFIVNAVAKAHPALFIVEPDYVRDSAEVVSQQCPDLMIWRCGIGSVYEKQLNSHPPLPSKEKISAEDAMMLGFTSGTTGEPKGLLSSHGATINSLKLLVNNLDQPPDRKVMQVNLTAIPVIGAGSGMVMPTLLSGGTLILMPHYSPAHLVELVKAHGVTRLFLTPSQLIDLLELPAKVDQDMKTVSHIVYGTAPMPAAKLEEAIQRFGPLFQQGYGQAEILPPVSMLRTFEHVVNGQPAPRDVLRSCGRVVKGVSVRIVDQQGNSLPAGTTGAIQVNTPTRLQTYLDARQNQGVILEDGFFVTGDEGYLDKNGYLHVLDRQADLITTPQGVIYPRLVEEEAHDHPAVRECCLVAIADRPLLCVSVRQKYQQEDKAVLKAEIMALLADRLEAWQLPAEIVFAAALPRSFLGKVLRREVREKLRKC